MENKRSIIQGNKLKQLNDEELGNYPSEKQNSKIKKF